MATTSQSLMASAPIVPVTALQFADSERLLLVGQGAWVSTFEVSSGALVSKFMALPRAVVHGFSIGSSGEALVFGQRRVRELVCGAREEGEGIRVMEGRLLPLLDDFVKDALSLAPQSRGAGGPGIAVGFAHNFVELWCWGLGDVPATRLLKVVCSEQLVLHSMALHASMGGGALQVAAGTVMNELLLWNMELNAAAVQEEHWWSAANGTEFPVAHRLQGHEGGVFCVRWSLEGNSICSCSDDRTVRFWRRNQEGSGTGAVWDLVWTGWGHSARVWDLCWSRDGTTAVSCGEDTTARVWRVEDGKCQSVLSNHAGRNLWRLAMNDSATLVATGGNDCCPKLNSLVPSAPKTIVLALPFSAAVPEKEDDDAADEDDVEGSPDAKRSKPVKKKKKKKKAKLTADPIVGIHCVSPGLALAAQASGALWRMSHHQSSRVTIVPLPRVGSGVEDNASVSGAAWSACAVGGNIFAAGTPQGQIKVYELDEKCEVATEKYTWDGSSSHQRLLGLWFCGNKLISTTPNAQLRVWSWESHSSGLEESCSSLAPVHERSLKLSAAASVASVCLIQTPVPYLAVGDSRGHLSLFAMSNAPADPTCDELPESVLRRTHGTHQVSHLLLRGEYLYSCGFDGWVHTYKVVAREREEQSCLKLVASQPAGPISSVTELSLSGDGGRMVVAGFHGPHFIVADLSDNFEIFRVDCGGSKRPFTCQLQSEPQSSLVIPWLVWANTGAEAIEVWSQGGNQHPPKSLGGSFHGRELTCAAFCGSRLKSDGTTSIRVLTGAQDCLTKLVEFDQKDQKARVVQHMAPHPTAVRAVACSQWLPSCRTSLMVSGGGKLALKFWRLWHDYEGSREDEAVPCHLLASLENDASSSQDHRVLSVAALPWLPLASLTSEVGPKVEASSEEMVHLVATGDSEGRLSVYFVSEAGAVARLGMVHQRSGPILSLALSRLSGSDSVLCVAGSTSGEVAAWDLSHLLVSRSTTVAAADAAYPLMKASLPPLEGTDSGSVPCLFRVGAHQCGSNAISVKWHHTAANETPTSQGVPEQCTSVLCVVSGGDDQALSVTRIGFHRGPASSGSNDLLEVCAAACERIEGASGSALKGVSFASQTSSKESAIVSVGYDQRLAVWSLQANQPPLGPLLPSPKGAATPSDETTCAVSVAKGGATESKSLKWLSAELTDVSDVGGLAVSGDGNKALVFGQGAQLFDLHL